jgi:hypothetical protein
VGAGIAPLMTWFWISPEMASNVALPRFDGVMVTALTNDPDWIVCPLDGPPATGVSPAVLYCFRTFIHGPDRRVLYIPGRLD